MARAWRRGKRKEWVVGPTPAGGAQGRGYGGADGATVHVVMYEL